MSFGLKKYNLTLNKLIVLLTIAIFSLVPLAGYKGEYLWTKIFILSIFLSLVIIILIAKSYYGDLIWIKGRLLLPLILFNILSTISLLKAVNLLHGLSMLIVSICIFIILYQVLILLNGNDILSFYAVFNAIIYSSILISIYGLLQYHEVITYPIDFFGIKNPAATFYKTNQTAQFFICIIPYLFAITIFEVKRWKKTLLGLGVIISLYYLSVLGTEGAVVGIFTATVISLLLCLLWKKRKIRVKILSFSFILLLVSANLLCLMGWDIYRYLTSAPLSSAAHLDLQEIVKGSIGYRLAVWKSSLNIIKDNYLLGIGTGNYEIILPVYEIQELKRHTLNIMERVAFAQNDFIQLGAENGLITLLVFLWIVYKIFVMSLSAISSSKSLKDFWMLCSAFAGIIATLIHSLVSYNLYFPTPRILFILLIVYLERETENQKRDTQFYSGRSTTVHIRTNRH